MLQGGPGPAPAGTPCPPAHRSGGSSEVPGALRGGTTFTVLSSGLEVTSADIREQQEAAPGEDMSQELRIPTLTTCTRARQQGWVTTATGSQQPHDHAKQQVQAEVNVGRTDSKSGA